MTISTCWERERDFCNYFFLLHWGSCLYRVLAYRINGIIYKYNTRCLWFFRHDWWNRIVYVCLATRGPVKLIPIRVRLAVGVIVKSHLRVLCGNVNVNTYFSLEAGCLMWLTHYLVLEWRDKPPEDILEDWNLKFFSSWHQPKATIKYKI